MLPNFRYPFPTYDLFIANLDRVRSGRSRSPRMQRSIPAAEFEVCSVPVANPSKVIGGAGELSETSRRSEEATPRSIKTIRSISAVIHKTGLFLKACSSLVGSGEGIAAPQTGPPQRPRSGAGRRHRQAREQRLARRCAELRRRVLPSGWISRSAAPKSEASGNLRIAMPSWVPGS